MRITFLVYLEFKPEIEFEIIETSTYAKGEIAGTTQFSGASASNFKA